MTMVIYLVIWSIFVELMLYTRYHSNDKMLLRPTDLIILRLN